MGCIAGKEKGGERDLLDLNKDDPLHGCVTPNSYAEIIRTSIIAGEFEVTLRAIYKNDKQKRRDIAEKYSSTFHRDLIGDMKELSWKAGFITEALLEERLSGAARYLLYRLQSGTWTQNMAVVEIVCGHTANELTEIQKEYLNICGHTLVSDVQAKYDDEEVGHILIERLSLKESPADDTEVASVYSAQLVDAARNGMLFGDDHMFRDCITTNSASNLKLILEMFLKQCQRDMTVEIEKYYPAGHTREALITMVKLLRNRWLYMSHVIHELMSSEGEEGEKHLLYLVLSMDQDSASELKRVYKNTFFEMLARDLKETVKDPVTQRALLNHVK